MRITSMSARVLAAMMAVGSVVAFAGSYQWSGGDGRWADATKWNPNGVPGTGAGDAATFPVRATQAVTVDADTSLHNIDLAAKVPNVTQTFNITSGNTLTLDDFRLYKDQAADDITICGGGTLALTNQPFYASGTINPVKVTISGEGTELYMPKPTSSGLYVGSVDNNFLNSPDVFHVTAGARAIISNATCVGNALNGGGSIGRLVVDDGAYFYGGLFLYIGRNARVPDGVVCAVTNATLAARSMGVGSGWYQEFVGSNALLQATEAIEFPMAEFADHNVVRYSHMDFEDSRLEAPTIALIQGCHLSTGKLSRCVLTCDYLKSCLGKSSQNSLFDIVDCCVTCKDVRVSASLASNNVFRAIRTDIVSARIDVGFDSPHPNTFRVEGGTVRTGTLNFGHTAKAAEARYEQVGGTLTATNSLVAGSYDSVHCGAMFKGVSLYSPLILCGDFENTGMRSENAYLEFVDMERMETDRLYVGLGSIGAVLLVSNTTASVTYRSVANDTYATIVGRDSGATGNSFTLVDSTLNQTGGHVYVGRYSNATNNTLRLVRSTYDYKTDCMAKGDVIVGYTSGAKGNCMELDDHSTFKYDRAWMAVGHNGASNVLAICNGSSLELSSSASQLHIGYGGTMTGNRLVMENGGSLRVNTLYLDKNAAVEIAGSGNTMTLGNDISHTDGCSYVFRPGEDASDTPMLTINRAFQYSANRKIYVDVANAGAGRHVLLASTSALAEPAVGSSVIIENVPPNCSVRVSRSADTKSLVCSVAPQGTTIILK